MYVPALKYTYFEYTENVDFYVTKLLHKYFFAESKPKYGYVSDVIDNIYGGVHTSTCM